VAVGWSGLQAERSLPCTAAESPPPAASEPREPDCSDSSAAKRAHHHRDVSPKRRQPPSTRRHVADSARASRQPWPARRLQAPQGHRHKGCPGHERPRPSLGQRRRNLQADRAARDATATTAWRRSERARRARRQQPRRSCPRRLASCRHPQTQDSRRLTGVCRWRFPVVQSSVGIDGAIAPARDDQIS
jgi:hypothetical protein